MILNNVKNFKILILIISVMILFIGCNASPDPIMINNAEANHNLDMREITHNGNNYSYNIQDSSITINYPNDMIFTRKFNDVGDLDLWFKTSDIMDDDELKRLGYLTPNDIILRVLAYNPNNTSKEDSTGSPLIGFVLVLFGVGIILTPRAAWMIKYGWHYKDSEPSETAILFQRVSGVIVVIIGVFYVLK